MERRLSFVSQEFSNLNPWIFAWKRNTGQLLCSEMGLTFTHPLLPALILFRILKQCFNRGSQAVRKQHSPNRCPPSPVSLGYPRPSFILSKLGKNLVLILTWFKLLDPQPEVLWQLARSPSRLCILSWEKLLKNRVLCHWGTSSLSVKPKQSICLFSKAAL